MTKQQMTIEKWYGNGITIPGYKSSRYVPFLTSSMGLTSSVVKSSLGTKIAVRFGESNTAHADMENNTIVIKEDYMYGCFNRPIERDEYGRAIPDKSGMPPSDTITAIMGIVTHEAAHFAWSPRSKTEALAMARSMVVKGEFLDANIFGAILNIVEDIHIEDRIAREVPILSWTLDAINKIVFDTIGYEKARTNVNSIPHAAPMTTLELEAYLNWMIWAKTRKIEGVSTNGFANEVVEMVETVRGMNEVSERVHLCLDVYRKLAESSKGESSKDDGEGESGESEGDDKKEGQPGENKGGDKKVDSAAIENAIKQIVKIGEVFLSKKKGIVASTEDAREINSTLKEMDSGMVIATMVESTFKKVANIAVSEVTPLAEGIGIEYDKRYESLAEIARQRATINKPYGLDRRTGHTMRKLYRIATDQKVFAETVTMNDYKPMEVILLVDCSGSMMGDSIKSAMSAAIGATYGLANGRSRVAIYGHTGDIDGYDLVMYKFKGFDEDVKTAERRSHFVIPDRGGVLVQNRDGDAVRWTAGKFESTTRRRVMIVVSDGQPMANGYIGAEAIKHTKQEVENARAKGIGVYSISINSWAGETNNEIYGMQYNVTNDDPNCVADLIGKMIQ